MEKLFGPAGNAMSVPVIGACLMAGLCVVPLGEGRQFCIAIGAPLQNVFSAEYNNDGTDSDSSGS